MSSASVSEDALNCGLAINDPSEFASMSFFHSWASTVYIRNKAEAHPQSSLCVDEEVSLDPSTGTEDWSRVSVLVARTHPKVPSLLLRPPSDAMFMRCRDLNAFRRASSVATCCRDVRSCFVRVWRDGVRFGVGSSCDLIKIGRRSRMGGAFKYGM
jgi:hypothetical protein